MENNPMPSLDLEKYSRLLHALLPEALGLAICDKQGIPLLAEDLSDTDVINDALGFFNLNPADWEGGDKGVLSRPTGNGRMLYGMGLEDVSLETFGYIAVLTDQGDDPAKHGRQQSVVFAIENIAACLSSEFSLTQEAQAMAAELTERYEELNMVYDTNDQVKDFAEGQEALTQLVNNSAEYLNVNLVVLYLMDDKRPFCSTSSRDTLKDSLWIAEQLFNLYSWTKEKNTCVVINDPQEPLLKDLCPGIPHKILSCPVLDGDGNANGVLICVNASEKRDFTNSDRNILEVMSKKASKIVLSSYDSQTGLRNRRNFEYYVKKAMAIAKYKGLTHTVMCINIDQMHVINETAGHRFGDSLIRKVSGIIKDTVRDDDIIASLGGDVFGLLLENCSAKDSGSIAQKILKAVNRLDFEWNKQKYEVSVCIGVAVFSSETDSSEKIIDDAEVACKAAKETGRNRIQVYELGDQDLTRRKEEMQWVNRIQKALREDRFILYCQEIRPFKEGADNVHFEILLRMQDEKGEILSPFLFLPAAERFFLMPAIDKWVIKNTLSKLSESWSLLEPLGCVWSINLSGQTIMEVNILDEIVGQLRSSGVQNRNICFEITETATIGNLAEAQRFMTSLKEEGCSFSLDDFGTGLSSFSYLKDLPVDYLKIDGSFVKEIAHDPSLEAMVESINHIGQTLNLKTIAEFVKDDAITEKLQKMGVDFGQGYALGKPRPLAEQIQELINS